jgi:hypothetical protein
MSGPPFTDDQLAVIRAIVTETVDALMTRRNVGRYISGVISDVTGPDALVEPDDAPGTLSPATVTDAATQVIGARVVVWSGGPGTSYVHGVVP